MFIIDQDREYAIEFTRKLHIIPVIFNDILMGFNLYHGEVMLGTFDSIGEVEKEIRHIQNCNAEFYTVSGYAKWQQWEVVCESMLEDEVE